MTHDFPPEEQGFGPFFMGLYGEDWRTKCGYELHVEAADHKSMAHMMHSLGAFASVGEARRNGHAGDVRKGVHFMRIRGYKHRVVVE